MVDFGDRLKSLRLSCRMTQEALAKKLNVTKSVVSYYELHERTPSPEIIIKLSKIFHVSTDFLLGVNKHSILDVSDLSDDDIRILISLIEDLRNRKH